MEQGVTHDCVSFHLYFETPGFTGDYNPPAAVGGYGFTPAQLVGQARAFMVSKGDTSPMFCTEWSSQWEDDGPLTAQRQAQYAQDFLQILSGTDSVNNVLFSSYLKGMIWYAVTSQGGASYALFPTDNLAAPNPAVAIMAELVSGH